MMCNKIGLDYNEDPVDLPAAKKMISQLRQRCRDQTEQIMTWTKAYNIQRQEHYYTERRKTEQLNTLTSQLLLLEARLKRDQKRIASKLCQKEVTIVRQQKCIDALSNRLVEHGLADAIDPSYTDLDNLNDSDSAVVLEEIDSDSNSPFGSKRKTNGSDVTIMRSVSDAIETDRNRGARRSNCFLRRPDILETVYSVEEDPEPSTEVTEKRDKFKHRSENVILDLADEVDENLMDTRPCLTPIKMKVSQQEERDLHTILRSLNNSRASPDKANKQAQVTNYNRVMSNHRSVTKPKDVKYKRINKAKSKSLEELRGRLKHWVEKGSLDPVSVLEQHHHQSSPTHA